MHTLLRSSLVIVVASTLFACKPKPAPEAVAEAEPEAEEEGSPVTDTMIEACQITLSEPESQQWTTYWDAAANPEGGPSPSSARSFHWADPDEKKLLIKQNLTTPLDIICGSNDDPAVYVSLSAFSSGEQTIPMAPGNYDIVGKVSDELPPGQFQAGAILVGKDRFEAESGTLEIDRFDMSGVRGSFRLQGEDFTLDGSFEIPCRGGSPESLCEADKAIVSE